MLIMPASSLLSLAFLYGCPTPKESAVKESGVEDSDPQDSNPKESDPKETPVCTLYDLNPMVVPMGIDTEVAVTLKCDQAVVDTGIFTGMVDAQGRTTPVTRVDILPDGAIVWVAYSSANYGNPGETIAVSGAESIPLPLSVYNPSPDATLENTILDQLPSNADWTNWTESEDGLSWYVQSVTVDNDNGWSFVQGEVREGVVQALEETGSAAPSAFGKPRGRFIYGQEGARVVSLRQLETSRASLLIRKRIDKATPLIAAQELTDETAEWPGDSEVGADLLDMMLISTEGDAVVLGTAMVDGKALFVIRDESTGKDTTLSSIAGMTPDNMGDGRVGLLRMTGGEMDAVAADQVLVWAVSPENKTMRLLDRSGNETCQSDDPLGICLLSWPGLSVENPAMQTLDVDQDGNLDLVLMGTDTTTEQDFIQVWPGDGGKLPWGLFGAVLGLNNTKIDEVASLHVVTTNAGLVLVQVSEGQVGLDGQYLNDSVAFWMVDELMAGDKPEAMGVPMPGPSWHQIQGGSFTASNNASVSFVDSSLSVSGGSLLYQNSSGFDGKGISVRPLLLGVDEEVFLSLPPQVQTTTVRYQMRVRYHMGETAIGVMDGDGNWTEFEGIDPGGMSFSGHDSFSIVMDNPVFTPVVGVQHSVISMMIASPSGSATVLDASAALEAIGVPSEDMTIRPIRTDLRDGLDLALFAVVPMGIPKSDDKTYIIEATPIADGWDAPADDTALNFKLVTSFAVPDTCLENQGATLCGTTDHFRIRQGEVLPGVLEGWTEKTVEASTAMEGLVAALPWETGTACEVALVYIPGISSNYAENLAKATVLATSDDKNCQDLPRPVASGHFVNAANIEFQVVLDDEDIVLMDELSGIQGLQVVTLTGTSLWMGPVTPLPEELLGLGAEGDISLSFGGGLDANWDDVTDVYIAEIQNNPLAVGEDIGFNPLFGEAGHMLMLSDGRGGFLFNELGEVAALSVEGAVGVHSSSPVYAREKISKEEAEAIKAQLVEAGATVEIK